MTLPVIKKEIKGSFYRRVQRWLDESNENNVHSFCVNELERIRGYNPVIFEMVSFYSEKDARGGILDLVDLPPEVRNSIKRRLLNLSTMVYLLLESQAEADDMTEQIRLE